MLGVQQGWPGHFGGTEVPLIKRSLQFSRCSEEPVELGLPEAPGGGDRRWCWGGGGGGPALKSRFPFPGFAVTPLDGNQTWGRSSLAKEEELVGSKKKGRTWGPSSTVHSGEERYGARWLPGWHPEAWPERQMGRPVRESLGWSCVRFPHLHSLKAQGNKRVIQRTQPGQTPQARAPGSGLCQPHGNG